MPKRVFQTDTGELVIAWRGIWKDVTVTHAGTLLGQFANQADIKAGREFVMADGARLLVRLTTNLGGAQLEVLRNGAPVAGSDSDPAVQLKLAAGVTYFIGGLTSVLSIVAMLGNVGLLVQLGMGPITLGVGVLFLGLGFAVGKRSRIALGVAIALFILDAALSLAAFTKTGGTPPVGMIVMRVVLLIPMFRGFGAIAALERRAPR
jgi:hypothetical protein